MNEICTEKRFVIGVDQNLVREGGGLGFKLVWVIDT